MRASSAGTILYCVSAGRNRVGFDVVSNVFSGNPEIHSPAKNQGASSLRVGALIDSCSSRAGTNGAVDHRPTGLSPYGRVWVGQKPSKQIGHVTGAHARSAVLGHPVTGVGFGPKVACAEVTLIVSVKPNLPEVESMLFGK